MAGLSDKKVQLLAFDGNPIKDRKVKHGFLYAKCPGDLDLDLES